MNARPIGVFDSGLGGLTTVKKLSEFLPGEDIIYLGDTGRVPYGSRSKETIIRYASQDAEFLAGFDIKAMVIACNTACTSAFDVLDRSYDMPVYEVVSAPARTAALSTKNGKIGVIGTNATIRSGAYEAAIKSVNPDLEVFSAACPLFVPLVENGRYGAEDIAALAIAEDYLLPLREKGIDTLILGCTHYPLLRGVIAKIMGSDVMLVDSGAETARLVAGDLSGRDMLSQNPGRGNVRYFVTDSADGFATLASRFLESNVCGLVEQITLE
ncbi:MAG: glutamate racemase [Oscillospiraceae bacterium]|nr:glutamate racemase [Oscillospiraceae bacterium]